MSVLDRVEDARVLAQQGRNDGALLNVLLAVAAASAHAYPETLRQAGWKPVRQGEGFDGWRFREYLAPRLVQLIAGVPGVASEGSILLEFRGQKLALETVLYKRYRNALVHEGMLPHDVKWDPDSESNSFSISTGNELVLGGAWLELLARAALDQMPAVHKGPPRRSYVVLDESELRRLEQKYVSEMLLVPGAVDALFEALIGVDSENPNQSTDEDLQCSFQRLIEGGWVLEQHLQWLHAAECIDSQNRLTPLGIRLQREMGAQLRFEIGK